MSRFQPIVEGQRVASPSNYDGRGRRGSPAQIKADAQNRRTADATIRANQSFNLWLLEPEGTKVLNQRINEINNAAGARGAGGNQAAIRRQAETDLRNAYVPEKAKNILAGQEKPARSDRSSQQAVSNAKPTAQQTPKPFDFSTAPKPSDQELEPSNASIINQTDRTKTTGKAQTQVFNLNSFLTEVLNQDVLPSHSYLVTFAPFRNGFPENQPLTNFVTNKRSTLVMRCENVILPTPSLLEEENIRRYGYGPVEKVPYGVQFSDVSMTWLVDSKSEIIDFMHQWMNTIVSHDSPGISGDGTTISNSSYRDKLGGYSPFEVGYKDAYTNPIVRIYVYNRQQQVVTEYEMFDVFPMNIQSINLSWSDENQIQKLTVNFAYVNMRMKAPQKVSDQVSYDNLEALVSPYEEKKQPTDKGGKAAADAAGSPTGESIKTTANASRPNATESKQTAPTGVIVPPNSPQNRVLGP
jgi:hypothetical protein